ncbi:MAG: maleylpyruvate isomerase family mycothiol-dependent enzyme [Ilumatobacteraceae bacterium]
MSSIVIAGGIVDTEPDLHGILADIEVRRSFIVSLVQAGKNSDQTVSGLSWTVGELGAHLGATADNYATMAEGEVVMTESVSERRTVIDRGIALHVAASAVQQANLVEEGVDRLVTALRLRTDDERLPYYGMHVPPSLIAGMCLNELVVHGVDLARTHGRPVEVPDHAAYQSLLASCALSSFALTPWGRARSMVLGYGARGHAPIIIALDRGDVTVSHRTDHKVDAWFRGSAADLLLASYHRISALRSLRTLRLRGRRPYLALTVDKAFDTA